MLKKLKMIKKILNLFKNKKNKSRRKDLSNDKNKSAEVINFIKKSKNKSRIQTEQMEVKKMDDLAKELVENYRSASQKSFLCMARCFYFFLFRVMQIMIFTTSFPIYRHYHRAASKQIVENHKQWLHEFKEWENAKTEGKLMGEKRNDDENDTLH